MKDFSIWLYIFIAVSVALTANFISSMWANADNKNLWFIALLFVSPFVFITFGITTSKIGVAISSGVIDSLLTLTTICMGLFLFQEWNKISIFQYVGIILTISGVFLMVFFPRASS
jgi:multidrug transporter EmrE-like cation transporter